MIVRTAPIVLPAPDALRAMERLESQLRRAADDLAAELEVMRSAVVAPLIEVPDPNDEWRGRPRCGQWMRHRKAYCGRFAGHRDSHRSRDTMAAEAARKASSR